MMVACAFEQTECGCLCAAVSSNSFNLHSVVPLFVAWLPLSMIEHTSATCWVIACLFPFADFHCFCRFISPVGDSTTHAAADERGWP
jgi:hypothetical protein